MNKERFNELKNKLQVLEVKMARGGKREGAGRPQGVKTERVLMFTKRITAEEKEFLEKKLAEYRQKGE